MEHVSVDSVESSPVGTDADRRPLTEPLGTTDLAINHYSLDAGERLSGGVHAHADQEEVFVVTEGEVVFTTPEERVTVAAGEAIRFAPGEFQSGGAPDDTSATVLALGAPRDSEDVRVPFECPACSAEAVRITGPADEDGDAFTFVCPECDEDGTVDPQDNEMGTVGP